jgi:hypothetical protein
MACVNEQRRPVLYADLTDTLEWCAYLSIENEYEQHYHHHYDMMMIYTTILPSTSPLPFHHQHAEVDLCCRIQWMTRAQNKSGDLSPTFSAQFSNVFLVIFTNFISCRYKPTGESAFPCPVPFN